MRDKKTNVRYMTELALLVAIELVMRLLGLGSVPVGPLVMSFLTVPVAIGAMLLGPAAGAVLGAVFGFCSLYDAITGASMMTGVFFQLDPLNTVILCVGMRILMGFVTGWVFRLVRRVDRKQIACYVAGALSAPLLNTLFFMGYIVRFFYETDYVQNMVQSLGAVNPLMFVVLAVGVQGLVEAVASGVVSTAVAKGVAHVLDRS